jgi:hypothetical protein
MSSRRKERIIAAVQYLRELPRRDAELIRLTREGRELRLELTKTLVAARDLDKAARRRALTPYDAARLLSLRSRQSDLHTDIAAGTAALRLVRATSGAPADQN